MGTFSPNTRAKTATVAVSSMTLTPVTTSVGVDPVVLNAIDRAIDEAEVKQELRNSIEEPGTTFDL